MSWHKNSNYLFCSKVWEYLCYNCWEFRRLLFVFWWFCCFHSISFVDTVIILNNKNISKYLPEKLLSRRGSFQLNDLEKENWWMILRDVHLRLNCDRKLKWELDIHGMQMCKFVITSKAVRTTFGFLNIINMRAVFWMTANQEEILSSVCLWVLHDLGCSEYPSTRIFPISSGKLDF